METRRPMIRVGEMQLPGGETLTIRRQAPPQTHAVNYGHRYNLQGANGRYGLGNSVQEALSRLLADTEDHRTSAPCATPGCQRLVDQAWKHGLWCTTCQPHMHPHQLCGRCEDLGACRHERHVWEYCDDCRAHWRIWPEPRTRRQEVHNRMVGCRRGRPLRQWEHDVACRSQCACTKRDGWYYMPVAVRA